MYEVGEDDSITCLTCGDKIVTVRSHELFCKGFKREPWKALSITPERIAYWIQSEMFQKWASDNNIQLSA